MNWLDIVILIILALFSVRAYKRGIMKTLITFLVVIVAFIMTTVVSPIICNSITSNAEFMESLTGMVEEKLELDKKIGEQIDLQTGGTAIATDFDVEKLLDSVATYVSVPKQTLKMAKKELKNIAPEKLEKKLVHTISYSISYSIACSVVRGICFLVLYAVTFALLGVVAKTLNLVSRLPVIHGLNKFAGAVMGLLEGLLVIWLIDVVLFLAGFGESGSSIYKIIDGSLIGRMMYQNNPILNLISSIFIA